AEIQIEKENAWIDQTIGMRYDLSEVKVEQPFPLMELPNEIICIILRHLNTVDRLRARVNKRLYLLEWADQYQISQLTILQGDMSPIDPTIPGKVNMMLDVATLPSHVAFLLKLERNVRVESIFFSVR
ncbi:hypothetical protein PENTCL1PPCAC_3066, partial [Pristionchus entomophagus]